MLTILILLSLVLIFGAWMLATKPIIRWTVGLLSLLLLGGSVYLLTDHVLNHTGMAVQTTRTTKPVYSTADTNLPYGVLVKKEIGTSANNYVLVYRDTKQAAKPTVHFKPNFDHPAEMIKHNASYQYANTNQAHVTTTIKRYRWRSTTAKHFYGYFGEKDGQLISRKSLVTVPRKTWLVVTQPQSKRLKKIGQQLKAQGIQKQKQMQAQLATLPTTARAKIMAQHHQEPTPEQTVAKLKSALKSDK